MKALLFAFFALWNIGAAKALATELRAAVFVNPGHIWSQPFEQWINQVTAHGLIKIRLVGHEAISAQEQASALKAGKLDLIATPPGNYRTYMPEADAQVLSNMTLAEQRASGAYEALNQLLNKNINGFSLTTYGTGVPFHLYLKEPIQNISQLYKKRIRARIFQSFFLETQGIQTVTTDYTDVGPALNYSLIDGYAYTLWGISDLDWHKSTSQRIDPGFYSATVNIIINLDTWQRLSDTQQQSLVNASQWLEAHLDSQFGSLNDKAYRLQKSAGIEVFNAGPEFTQQAHDIYWQALEKKSPTHIPKLKRLLIK